MAYELKGPDYMRRKLADKRSRVLLRYKYYEMKNQTRDFGISTPPSLRAWNSTIGWCGKAVDSLADRLVFREFRNDLFEVNEIFRMNNPDIFTDSAILSALISSCCFVYIVPDADGFPRLQVIDGGNATGNIDPICGLLNEGYAVLSRDDQGRAVTEAWFTVDKTVYYQAGKKIRTDRHNVGYPLLVPIIYRPDAVRPFGHSRISRACMSITGSALRTIKRSEISAEFYSFPQKWVTGTAQDAEDLETWKASMSSLLSFSVDENGENDVKLGQFSQQSQEPHLAQLKMFASQFAGETGLTIDDLGFPSDNPSSSEAIKAAHENLRLTARKAQRSLGSGLLNVAFLAARLRDDFKYRRQEFANTVPIWEPAFEPDASSLSLIGDGVIKINQAVPGYIGKNTLRDLTGIQPGDST